MSLTAWTLTALTTYATAAILWFTARATGPVLLRLQYTFTRPTPHPIWRTIRGELMFCGYTWRFVDYLEVPPTQYYDPGINIFTLGLFPPGTIFWLRFRNLATAGYLVGGSPVFEVLIPDCPPPGGSGMTLMPSPPPPIVGDGNGIITLTPSVV